MYWFLQVHEKWTDHSSCNLVHRFRLGQRFRWSLRLCNQPCQDLQMARFVRLLRLPHLLHGHHPVLLPRSFTNWGQLAHGRGEDYRSWASPRKQDWFRGLAIQQVPTLWMFHGHSILHDVPAVGVDWAAKWWFDCFRWVLWSFRTECWWLTRVGPSIIASFGFNTDQSILLNMGSGACTVVGTIMALYLAKFTGRTIAGCYTLCLSCIGVIMMFVIPAEHYRARYGGYILTQ